MKAGAITGRDKFAANEVDVFHNREAAWSGNIFGDDNINPALRSCEPRLVLVRSERQAISFEIDLCLAKDDKQCCPCQRTFPQGSHTVIFPNAHMWLSSSWNSAQDYYH